MRDNTKHVCLWLANQISDWFAPSGAKVVYFAPQSVFPDLTMIVGGVRGGGKEEITRHESILTLGLEPNISVSSSLQMPSHPTPRALFYRSAKTSPHDSSLWSSRLSEGKVLPQIAHSLPPSSFTPLLSDFRQRELLIGWRSCWLII